MLTRLLAISQEVKTGHGSTVLLQGDGGIGKTRLLHEFLARLTTEVKQGDYVAPSRLTFRDYMEKHWLKSYAKPRVAGTVYQRYETMLRAHLFPAFGPRVWYIVPQAELSALISASR